MKWMTNERSNMRATLSEIEDGLNRLERIWAKIEQMTGEDGTTDIQEIAVLLNSLRDMIDQVEVRLARIEGQVSDIESMRFRIRSGL